MAAVPIQIDGVFYPHSRDGRSQPIKGSMTGYAYIVGLAVGGGPIVPPESLPPDSGPPGTPTHPIWGPPGTDFPDKPGYPPVAGHPLPPIPEPPPELPPGTPPNSVVKPPVEGGWGYITDANGALQAVYNPGPAGAQPKR